MTSIVGRLARTLSGNAGGGLPEVEHHRRNSSIADGSPRVLAAGSLSSPTRMSTSPSFNDFSLSVQEDVAEEYGPIFNRVDTANGSLMSDDTIFAMDKASFDTPGQQGSLAWGPFAAVLSPRAARPPTVVTAPNVAATAPQAVPTKTKSVKIMGMDAYDYCDLLRSSSL